MAVAWTTQEALAIDADAAATEASNALQAYLTTNPFTTVAAPVSTATDAAALKNAVLAGNYASRLSDVMRRLCHQNSSSASIDPTFNPGYLWPTCGSIYVPAQQ